MKWNEGIIAGLIARQTLARKCVLLVDRCNWTGAECDVLGVTVDLRVIDVEVKISRADLKADKGKDKWWKRVAWRDDMGPPQLRPHPPKVWKHYYALPAEIWKPELLEFLPSPASGVLLVRDRSGVLEVYCERRSTPNKDAARLSPESVIDIARLANLRMWDAYTTVETARRDANYWREQAQGVAA